MTDCMKCRKPLNKSQYRDSRQFKSCPACSMKDGQEHVFYPFPSEFGTTEFRVTVTTPDGAQSHCALCRGGQQGPYVGARKCSSFP
jgi:hypothetical protein